MIVKVFETAVFVDQRKRGFFADTRYTGYIVGRIAHHALQVDYLQWFYTRFFFEIFGVVDFRIGYAASRKIHRRSFVDKLKTVFIAGYNHGFVLISFRHTSDYIVSLYTGLFVTGNAERIEYGFQKVYLRTQILGHGFSRSLVIGIHKMTKSRFFSVECDKNVLRLQIGDYFHQHINKCVNRVSRFSVFGRKRRRSVKRPVYKTVAVDKNEFVHKNSFQ